MHQRKQISRSVNRKQFTPSGPRKRSDKNYAVSRTKECWHGLIATLDDGTEILEKNNYLHKEKGRVFATNWWEIPKKRIKSLELYHKGKSIVKLEKDQVQPEEWFFSHTATLNLGDQGGRPTIVSRNIGFIKNGLKHVFRVIEKNGALEADAAPYQA